MAHQYIAQLDEKVAPAFGNVGTIICFRVGAEDAEFLAKIRAGFYRRRFSQFVQVQRLFKIDD